MQKYSSNQPKKLVIVGGGFAGISLARQLARDSHYQITLISDSDNFKYYPLLYRVATGHTRFMASFPIPFMLFDKPQISFIKDKVTGIDTEKHVIKTESGTTHSYDTAAFALGMVTTYFNIPGLAEHALGTKSADQALELRHHLHDEMLKHKDGKYTCVVVGGGPTGVELAAATVGYLRRVARLHGLPTDKVDVRLVESGPRLLRYLPERGSARVERRVRKLGVTILTGKVVQSQTDDEIVVSGESIKTDTVVWTAGVSNNPLFASEKAFTLTDRGRVSTDPYLLAAPDVYVLGDNAATPYAGLAETAVSNGKYLATQLERVAAGKKAEPYHPHNPISVVPVGEGWAVANYKKLVFTGWAASLLRRIADLIGYWDVASLSMALTLWLSEHRIEDECQTCRQHTH